MLIRLATLQDLPDSMNLVRQVVPLMRANGNFQWDEQYPNGEVFENDIRRSQLWVAVLEERVAGLAAITTDQEPEYGQLGWDITRLAIVTHRLVVGPAFQGKGVAKALLQQAEQVAYQRGIDLLRIDTNTQNQATQRLFPQVGYVLAGEIGLRFRPGLRFLCYEKKLNG